MRTWSILQGMSRVQLKQALKLVRNVCQPKSDATTGNVPHIRFFLAGRGNLRLGQCYCGYNKL